MRGAMVAPRDPDRALDLSQAQGALIGDHGIQYNWFAGLASPPPQPVQWPVMVGRIPPLADCLQPREPQERALARAADTGGTVVLTQVLAGMGRVGKTQIAAAYAQQ